VTRTRASEETVMRLRNLLLIGVIAALAFGGTFTCNTNDDDDDDFHITSTNK
jgi:hypothetical protein